MSYLIDMTKDIMEKALHNFSKENSSTVQDVQLVIYTDDKKECLPKYRLYKQYAFLRETNFHEILNVSVDFLGREQIATPFLADTIKRMASEISSEPNDIRIMILKKDVKMPEHLNKKNLTPEELIEKQKYEQPEVWLFKNEQLIRKLSFKGDIFLED